MTASLPEPDHHDPDQYESPTRRPDVHGWIPFTDVASRAILEAAVLNLVAHRGGRHDEPSDAISVLVSLLAEGECLAMASQEWRWSRVGDELARSR